MGTKLYLLIISLFFTGSAFTQSLDKKDLRYLHDAIGIYLSNQETLRPRERIPEFIICLLDIDTTGKVSNIHLLADDKNKDSTYSYLSRMTGNAFKDWKFEKCKNKTIAIPLLSLVEGKEPENIRRLREIYTFKRHVIEYETSSLVLISAIVYETPRTRYEKLNDKTQK